MTRFVLERVSQAVVTLLAASLLVFIAARLTGDPADALVSIDTATPTGVRAAEIRESLGLDRPYWEQYFHFVWNAAQGDFGLSYYTTRPVNDAIVDRLWPTLSLAFVSLAIAAVIGIPLGVLSAVYRGTWVDSLGRTIALFGQAVPGFWLGLVLIIIFSVKVHWLPTGGTGGWKHYVLPGVTMGLVTASTIVRLLRSSMLDVLSSDYIRFGRSFGMPERQLIWTWGLRNALIPVVAYFGVILSILVGGAVLVEVVFAWPGLGQLSYDAVFSRDFPTLQATVVVWAAMVVVGSLITDLVFGLLDPRART
jgi:peptide/nickel transport system permease protein